MKKIEEVRNEIDEIDKKMAELYVQRMDAVKKVIAYKKEYNLPVFDKKREQDMKKNRKSWVPEEYQKSYFRFLQWIMDESKQFQNKERMK